MKKYVLKNKGLAMGVLLFSICFSTMSALVALIIRRVLDIAVSLDLTGFQELLFQSIIFFIAASAYFLGCIPSFLAAVSAGKPKES